jgi:putative flippase GtrA
MSLASSRIGAALIRKARTNVGVRFTRFTLVAVASVIASQVALSIFIGPANMTAGISGALAAIIGAAVSYVLSRWAWERKGRPQLLKETLPFWLVSVGAWVILGLAAKLGVALAGAIGADGIKRVLITDSVYFAANCLTFLGRFVIFHYVLFADGRSDGRSPRESGPPISSSSEATVVLPVDGANPYDAANPDDAADPDPFAMAVGPAESGVAGGQPCAGRGDADAGPNLR